MAFGGINLPTDTHPFDGFWWNQFAHRYASSGFVDSCANCFTFELIYASRKAAAIILEFAHISYTYLNCIT